MPLSVEAGCASDAGPRETNEDAVRTIRPGLHVLADGTGGRAGGRVAADLACETLFSELSRSLADPAADVEAAINAAVRAAHQIIRERQADPALHGMATTLVVLASRGTRLHVAHVGDSRAYLLRGNQLSVLTRDHSLANYLADNPGVVLKVQRPGETLMRALGLNAAPPEVEHRAVDLRGGEVVLACSDGVSNPLPEWVLQGMLASARTASPEEVASDIVRAAIAHGSMDNASAVVVRVEEEAPRHKSQGWVTFLEGPRQGQVLPVERVLEIGPKPGADVATDASEPNLAGRVEPSAGGYLLRNAGTKPGTFINDSPVVEQWLADGDVIRVGSTKMMFKSLRLS